MKHTKFKVRPKRGLANLASYRNWFFITGAAVVAVVYLLIILDALVALSTNAIFHVAVN